VKKEAKRFIMVVSSFLLSGFLLFPNRLRATQCGTPQPPLLVLLLSALYTTETVQKKIASLLKLQKVLELSPPRSRHCLVSNCLFFLKSGIAGPRTSPLLMGGPAAVNV
jgi:hypothetical protein